MRQVVIMAGGRGTRLAPYTAVIPKPLLPIGDRPVLDIILRQMRVHGFTKVTLAVGYLSEIFEAVIGNGSKYGLEIEYFRENEPLGTAGSLGLIQGLDGDFLVMMGDVLTTLDFSELLEFHRARRSVFTIAVAKRKVDIDYGVLQVNSLGEIVQYQEKPVLDYSVSMGVYAVNATTLKYIVPNHPLDIPTLTARLLEGNQQVFGFLHDGYWLDIGRPSDYERAVSEFPLREPDLIREPTTTSMTRVSE